MTAITFDTLKFANRLKSAGVPDKQAEAMAEAQAEIFDKNLEDVATRQDLKELEIAMRRDLKEQRLEIAAELAPLKWGMAITVGGIVTILLKSFSPH